VNSELFKYREKHKEMEFYFPAFFSSLRYDPDVTIIDLSSPAVTSSTSNSGFIVGVTLGVVFASILVVILVLVVVFLYRRRQRLAKQEETWKGINFDEELTEITPSNSNESLANQNSPPSPSESEGVERSEGTSNREEDGDVVVNPSFADDATEHAHESHQSAARSSLSESE
jgi:hypothetical protein